MKNGASTAMTVTLAGIVFLLLFQTMVGAQTITGNIQGAVRDQSGAALPGVTVTVENVNTRIDRTTLTNESGNYDVALLPPGTYTVAAELLGFRKEVKSGITVQVNQTVRIDFDLAVGSVTESIEVTAVAPLVQSQESAIGQVVSNIKITELPLNGRSFRSLALITPGVQDEGQNSNLVERGGGLNISGARVYDNNYLVDGFDNNSRCVGEILVLPSVDSIQEFRILSANYGAESGFGYGGVISLITKSGSSQFHGSAFEFLRNSAMDARNFFALEKKPFKRNQYGASLGGPFWFPGGGNGRSFFFASYEGTNIREGLTKASTVPTAAMKKGDFSSLGKAVVDPLTGQPFPGNIIPSSRITPIGKSILDSFYPDPNSVGVRNLIFSPNFTNNLETASFRVDHNPSAANSFFTRYIFYRDMYPFSRSIGGDLPLTGTRILRQNQGLGLTWIHVFGAKVVQEARLGYARENNDRGPANHEDWDAKLGIIGAASTTRKSEYYFAPPQVQLTGYTGVLPFGSRNVRLHNNWDSSYALAITRRDHNIKTGAAFRKLGMNFRGASNPQGTFIFTGQYARDAITELLLGIPTRTSRRIDPGGCECRGEHMAAYIQDDWRLSQRLTFNYGVRYEYQFPDVDQYDKWGSFVPELGRSVRVGTEGVPRSVRQGDLNNLGPRIGFAWDVQGNGRKAVRLGYGIYFEDHIQNVTYSFYGNPPIGISETFNAPLSSPNISMSNPFPTVLATDTSTTSGVARNMANGYVQRWSLDFQQALGANQVFDIGYVGSLGIHLRRANIDINQAALGPGSVASRRRWQNFGSIGWKEGSGTATYHSLQMKFERRLSSGLDFLTSYAFSKSIDNALNTDGGDGDFGIVNTRDLSNTKALSPTEKKHRFTYSATYELPFGSGKPFWNGGSAIGAIVSNWQISGILALSTGPPFTPRLSIDRANIGGGNQAPNRIKDGTLPHSKRGPDGWFDTSAFTLPAVGTFGNSGRNILIGPGKNTVDAALSRRFKMAEDKSIQFRAEFFNLFNHPNFNIPNQVVDDTARFGKIFEAAPGRQIQFGLKLVY